MLMELDDLITILDDAVDMQDNGKYQDILDNAYQDGILHDLIRHLNKQTKRVQELENHITKMAVSRWKDSEELDEVNKQNKRYREWLERAFKADDLEDIWDIEDEYLDMEDEK